MPEKSYTPAPIRHLIQSRVEARSGFGPSLSGTAGILLVTALILGTLTCATPPPADHSSVNASGIIPSWGCSIGRFDNLLTRP